MLSDGADKVKPRLNKLLVNHAEAHLIEGFKAEVTRVSYGFKLVTEQLPIHSSRIRRFMLINRSAVIMNVKCL